MKKLGLLVAAAAALSSQSVFGSLLVATGFEFGTGAPDASAADSNTPITAAAQNPWYGPRSGGQAYSNSTGAFSGSGPARNRIGSGGDTAHTGAQYAYAYSTGNTFGYVAQNVTGASIVAGDTYSASAYFLSKAANPTTDGDRLQGGSADSIRLLFLDSTGATISTANSGTIIDSTSPYNVWTQGSIFSAVAPVGTATIEFQAYLTRGSAGGVMFVDDADLEDVTANSVPEPASLGLVLGVGALVKRRRR